MLKSMSMIDDQEEERNPPRLGINRGIELMLPRQARREEPSPVDLDVTLPLFKWRVRVKFSLDVVRQG